MDDASMGELNRSTIMIGSGGAFLAIVAGFFIWRANRPKPINIDPLFGDKNKVIQRVTNIETRVDMFWHANLAQLSGKTYVPPEVRSSLVDRESPCWTKGHIAGNSFCPIDHRLSFDLRYYSALEDELAVQYSVAHLSAHHIQEILDRDRSLEVVKVREANSKVGDLELRYELQADFLAGMFLKRHLQKLDPKELDKSLHIIQDQSLKLFKGVKVLDPMTHGDIEQRKRWIIKGFNAKKIKDGDTFHAKDL